MAVASARPQALGRTASMSFTVVPVAGFFLLMTTGAQSWLNPDMVARSRAPGALTTVTRYDSQKDAGGMRERHVTQPIMISASDKSQ